MTTTSLRPVLLVVARSPVPGAAKTRLAPAFGPVGAARLAHAALLDTLDASREAARRVGADVVVALAGRVCAAVDPRGLVRALADVEVHGQRGTGFAERLANAHADAAFGRPCLQIGMDTPQVTASLLATLLDDLASARADEAGLGAASDGGWWALAVPGGEHARCLRTVPMSRPDTGARTREALRAEGLDVRALPLLTDVDTAADVVVVAPACAGRFGRVADELGRLAS